MEKREMLKQAAQTLRDQKQEIDELRAKLAHYEKAEMLVKKLMETDELEAEDILQKLSDFRSKPLEELDVMEKAAHYFHGTQRMGLGKLSDYTEGTSNALLDFLFEA